MRVRISNTGNHDDAADPDAKHFMSVDGHGLLVNLTGIRISAIDPGSLTDPTIESVEWGPNIAQGSSEAGVIRLRDGTKRFFHTIELLKPYIAAYEAAKASKRGDT